MFQTTIAPQHLDVIAQEDDLEIMTHYSGRFMYGSSCFGMVTSDPLSVLIRITRAAHRGLRDRRR